MRFTSLLVVAALGLGTGCISGIDQKPYDISLGPRITADDQPALMLAALLAAVIVGGVYVVTDSAR